MLVLKRRAGEKILIGDNIVVTLIDTLRPGEARIGIDAPKSVRVLRSELAEKVAVVSQECVAGGERNKKP